MGRTGVPENKKLKERYSWGDLKQGGAGTHQDVKVLT